MNKMIIIETRQGLSNRMRVIASAYKLAREFDSNLIIMWPEDKWLNCSFYSIFQPIPNLEVRKIKGRFLPLLIRKSNYFIHKKAFYNITYDDINDVKEYLKKNQQIFISTVHNFYAEENDYSIFKMTLEIENKANNLIGNYNDLVGIHIRRTDNAISIRESPTNIFIKKIDELISKNDTTHFYLSTDSIEEEKLIRDIFGQQIIINPDKELRRNTPRGIMDAAIDMKCLSMCKEVYGSFYSSFSEAAAAMGGGKVKILKK